MKTKKTYKKTFQKKKEVGDGLDPKAVKQVRRMIKSDIETKYLLITQPQYALNVIPIRGDLSVCSQGTSDNNERIGDQISLIGTMDLRLFVGLVNAPANNYSFARFVVLQWKPKTVPTANEIFQNGSSGVVDYTSQYARDNRSLYKILWDKTFKLIGAGTAGSPFTDSSAYEIRKFIKYQNKKINYIGAASNIMINGLYMFSLGNSDVAAFYTATILYDDA